MLQSPHVLPIIFYILNKQKHPLLTLSLTTVGALFRFHVFLIVEDSELLLLSVFNFFYFFCCNNNKKDSVGNSEFSFSSFIRNISFINSFINRKRVLVGTLNEDGEMQPSSGQCQNCTLRVIRKLFSNAIFLFFRLNKKLF